MKASAQNDIDEEKIKCAKLVEDVEKKAKATICLKDNEIQNIKETYEASLKEEKRIQSELKNDLQILRNEFVQKEIDYNAKLSEFDN